MGNPILVAGGYEVGKERVRLQRLGFELGMELAAEGEGVAGDLDDLDVGGVRGGSGQAEASSCEDGFVLAVELVPVAVAFGDLGCAVGLGGERAGLEDAGPGAEAHGSAHLFDAGELAELVDDAVRGGRIELAGVGSDEATD